MSQPLPAAELLATLHELRADVQRLTMRGPGSEAYEVPLLAEWRPLPGRSGVLFFHVPDPAGTPNVFLAAFATAPGAHYRASVLDTSRLLVLADGCLFCNERRLTPGQAIWLAPGEPTSWYSPTGATGTVRYGVPPPDVDLSDILTPIKP